LLRNKIIFQNVCLKKSKLRAATQNEKNMNNLTLKILKLLSSLKFANLYAKKIITLFNGKNWLLLQRKRLANTVQNLSLKLPSYNCTSHKSFWNVVYFLWWKWSFATCPSSWHHNYGRFATEFLNSQWQTFRGTYSY